MAANMTSKLPDSFMHFDSLPNSAHVRIKTVALLLDCSVPTVWRKIQDGTIPAPIKLSSHVTAFNVGKLRAELLK